MTNIDDMCLLQALQEIMLNLEIIKLLKLESFIQSYRRRPPVVYC